MQQVSPSLPVVHWVSAGSDEAVQVGLVHVRDRAVAGVLLLVAMVDGVVGSGSRGGCVGSHVAQRLIGLKKGSGRGARRARPLISH